MIEEYPSVRKEVGSLDDVKMSNLEKTFKKKSSFKSHFGVRWNEYHAKKGSVWSDSTVHFGSPVLRGSLLVLPELQVLFLSFH